MKRLGFIAVAFFVIHSLPVQAYSSSSFKRADFFLYNKHRRDVYYSISIGNAVPGEFHRVNSKRGTKHMPLAMNKETHVFIAMDRKPSSGDMIDHYIFRNGQYRFIHMKIMALKEGAIHEKVIDDECEVVRENYRLRLRTNYDPKLSQKRISTRTKEDTFTVERIKYMPTSLPYELEVERVRELEAMSVHELEQELICTATLLAVVKARGKKDGDQDLRLEAEQYHIRRLLGRLYPR